MNDLSVGRLTGTVADWPDPDQVPRLLRHVADTRLQDAVRSHPLPDGEWCVRRVDVDLELDPDRPESALEADWADQIVIALRRSLRDGSQDVVRYERHEQAVDELLAGVATGDHSHAWAWRQVGLLTPEDPQPGPGSGELSLRVLERLPYGVAATVTRLVERVGAAAVHRLLGRAGWSAVARLAAREVGATPALLDPTPLVDPAAEQVVDESASGRRAVAATTTSPMATALRGSGVRPDEATRWAWGVLVLAGADPAALGGPQAPDLVRRVAALLRTPTEAGLGSARTPSDRPRGSPAGAAARGSGRTGRDESVDEARRTGQDLEAVRGAGSGPESGPDADPGGATTGSLDAGSAPAASVVGARTVWGGLLCLLNTASEAGLPETLDEAPLGGRPTPWLVQQLGLRLVPALPDDPAVLALSGVDPDLSDRQPPPDDSEAAALDRCAARWAAATASRLRPGETERPSDAEQVRLLARRDATVVREPGWVEVVLRLEDVDLDVRRSGLDIDPGWVWWLGQVVRFVYE